MTLQILSSAILSYLGDPGAAEGGRKKWWSSSTRCWMQLEAENLCPSLRVVKPSVSAVLLMFQSLLTVLEVFFSQYLLRSLLSVFSVLPSRYFTSIFFISWSSLIHLAIVNYSVLAHSSFPTQFILVSPNCSQYLYFSSLDVKKGLCNVQVKSQCGQLSTEK